ncbi:MAG: hypothetical protein M1820_008440 [Bogoriella megaspora]|nr:MAG: hypothetical protein M1820_008440 [Bogoriella megaspora]
MVSFSCENCGDVLAKKKLDSHRGQCYGASFTCLDCMVTFHGTDYRAHTSCISEAQKYQGAHYREKRSKSQSQPKTPTTEYSQAVVPHKAYVEDAADADANGAIAIVSAPPKAPTPPPAAASIEPVNVFDFLVNEETPTAQKLQLPPPDESRMIEDGVHPSTISEQPPAYPVAYPVHHYPPIMPMEYGYSYGSAPLHPTFDRYDSYPDLLSAHQYVTPANKRERDSSSQREGENEGKKESKSEKKRKRHHVESLDLSLVPRGSQDEDMTDAPPTLHSGLTGGLNRLMSRHDLPPSPEYSGDASGPSPTEPRRLKNDRSKEDKKEKHKTRSKSTKSVQSKSDTRSRKTSGSSHTSSHRHHRSDRSHHSKSHHGNSPQRHDTKHHRDRHERPRRARTNSDSPSNPPRKQLKAIEYHKPEPTSTSTQQSQQLIPYNPNERATRFLSFVTKGPDSERGCSINKALKRWHRERDGEDSQSGLGRGGGGRNAKWEEEKELWKSLRLRKNERGEIVLFM